MSKFQSNREWNLLDWEHKILNSKDTNYQLIKYLGKSGFGHFFITLTSDYHLRAIKIFENKKYFDFEVETIKYISKKIDYILNYDDNFIYSFEGFHYPVIVFCYEQGYVPLFDFWEKWMFFDERKKHIEKQIKETLTKIHQMNIVHQNLDLQNILICTEKEKIKFLDLGFCISKFHRQLSDSEFNELKDKDLLFTKNI
jgi:serine/threonine protein kinase